jgi:hypothetical protein
MAMAPRLGEQQIPHTAKMWRVGDENCERKAKSACLRPAVRSEDRPLQREEIPGYAARRTQPVRKKGPGSAAPVGRHCKMAR